MSKHSSRKPTGKHRRPKKEPVAPIHRMPEPAPIIMPDKVVIHPQAPPVICEPPILYRGQFCWWDTAEGVSKEVLVNDCKSAEEAHEELTRKAIEQGWKRPANWNIFRMGETKPEDDSTVVKQGRPE